MFVSLVSGDCVSADGLMAAGALETFAPKRDQSFDQSGPRAWKPGPPSEGAIPKNKKFIRQLSCSQAHHGLCVHRDQDIVRECVVLAKRFHAAHTTANSFWEVSVTSIDGTGQSLYFFLAHYRGRTLGGRHELSGGAPAPTFSLHVSITPAPCALG